PARSSPASAGRRSGTRAPRLVAPREIPGPTRRSWHARRACAAAGSSLSTRPNRRRQWRSREKPPPWLIMAAGPNGRPVVAWANTETQSMSAGCRRFEHAGASLGRAAYVPRRQREPRQGAAGIGVRQRKLSTVRLHDRRADRQTEAKAVVLGRIEWLEQPA